MKSALVLVFSNLNTDARVLRQVSWLAKRFATTVICFNSEPVEGVEIISIPQTSLTLARKAALGTALALRQYPLAYRLFHDYSYLIPRLAGKRFDLVVANDIDTLPLAFRLGKGARILFDAHEYSPRHFENRWSWRTFFQPFYINLCRKYIPRTDAMLTVGDGLAKEYAKNFGARPVIITNASRYSDVTPSPLVPGKIRLIHHGIANASRKIELMIDMMDRLDSRFTLDMILMTSDFASGATKKYIEGLRERIKNDERIRILPGVRSSLVVSTINQYDMGVFLIPPVNFNYANTLPNKLFDFIQARLAVAIGPTPEMAAIVRKYDIGVVSENFEAASLAAQLQTLTAEKVAAFKRNATNAAAEHNAEKNEQVFNTVVDKLLDS